MDDRIHWADINYFESWRLIVSASPSSDIREAEGLLITCSGLPAGFFNVAFVTRPLADPEAAIEKGLRFFSERKLPGLVCFRDGVDPCSEEVVRKRGLNLSPPHPGMVLYPIPKIPAGNKDLEITRIESDSEIDDFARIAEAAFGMPAGVPRQLTTQWSLQHPAATFFLGRADGKPIATSALIRTGPVAGVYWVTTAESFRGRGFGEAMSWAAIHAGVEAGCDMASLQASEMGRPVYERMGFKVVAPYNNYEVPPPS